MNKEEKEALERIQQELLKEEAVPEELQTEPDYLESIKALLGEEELREDSMEHTQLFSIPDEEQMPEDFGDYQDTEPAGRSASGGDARMGVLTVTAVLLTLGILGVLLRWVLLFLR